MLIHLTLQDHQLQVHPYCCSAILLNLPLHHFPKQLFHIFFFFKSLPPPSFLLSADDLPVSLIQANRRVLQALTTAFIHYPVTIFVAFSPVTMKCHVNGPKATSYTCIKIFQLLLPTLEHSYHHSINISSYLWQIIPRSMLLFSPYERKMLS